MSQNIQLIQPLQRFLFETMENIEKSPLIELNKDIIAPFIQDTHGTYKDRYVLFGTKDNGTVMYDAQTQTVFRIPDPPHGELTLLNDVLYAFEQRRPIQRLSLSPKSKWEKVHTILETHPYTTVSFKNYLYIFGFHSLIYCYDTIADELTKISKIPNEVLNFTVAAVANRIYIIGGWNRYSHEAVATVQVFDIVSQTWSISSPLPKALREGTATAVLDRWIIFSGGFAHYRHHPNYQLNDKIFVFDGLSQKWCESEVKLSPPRKMHKCITVRCHMMYVGGLDDSYRFCPLQVIDIKNIIPDWTYEQIRKYILVRKLVDEGRATPIVLNFDYEDKVMQNLITDLSLDMFRNVLSYLIHPQAEHDRTTRQWRNSPPVNKNT